MTANSSRAHPASQDRAGQAPPEAAKASSPYGDHPIARFTPGPWIVRHCQGDAYVIPAAHLERPLGCSIFAKDNRERYALQITRLSRSDLPGFGTPAKREANASLIAAAPELYEALDGLVSVYGLTNDKAAKACSAAIAALRKARGQQ